MLKFLLQRLREPSSWAGFATIAAMGAQALQSKDPSQIAAVVSGVCAVLVPEQAAQVSQAKP